MNTDGNLGSSLAGFTILEIGDQLGDYAAMLLAPLCVMPRLMPSTTEDTDFAPDIIALMRHVPGQEDTAGLEAASALTGNPEFLKRVNLCARRLRPLIRNGGITHLPRETGGDQAGSASV